jgi:hypothetical protein
MVMDNLLRQDVSASWADVLGGEVGLTLGMRLRAGEITPSEFGRYFEEVFSQQYTRFVPEVEVRNLLVTVSTIGFTVFGGPVEAFDNDGRPTYVVDILEWLLPLRDR